MGGCSQRECCSDRQCGVVLEGEGQPSRPKNYLTKQATPGRYHSFSSNPPELQRQETPQNDFEQMLEFISKVPLFQSIPMSDRPMLARAFTLKSFPSGTDVIRQGEIGQEFYVVLKGTAQVLINGNVVNSLGTGDFFGELALLHNSARNATITAVDGALQCWVISRKDFNALDLRRKLNFKKRKAVMMTDHAPGHSQDIPSKTPEEKALIRKAFQSDRFLGPLLDGMRDEELQNISDHAFAQLVPSNTDIIVQGDMKADLFYIMEHGTAEVIIDGVKVGSYAEKGSFGGLALLYQAPRSATVRIISPSKLWCIPRSAMRSVLQQHVKDTVAGYTKLLKKVRLFDQMSAQDRDVLADALLETTYTKGQIVTKQGEDLKAFFMLISGELSEVANGVQVKTIKAETDKDFPFFGERELSEGMPQYYTREVLSDKATFLVLDADIFQRLADSATHDVQERDFIQYRLTELSTVALLGCGGFGKVTLQQHARTRQHFALKRLSKGFIIAQKQQTSVLNEKRILRMTRSPFLIQVAATFNSDQHLFFLLEPALGGELFTLYMVHQLHGQVPLALFYSACVALGFQHLHKRCILYRDMKPENLLLDAKGYCKITDFGLAKFCVGKTFTTCGTPDYFAPELVKGIGHTASLDWWTLGILVYELLKGVTPFAADNVSQIFAKIMQGFDRVPFDARGSKWPDLVKDLCKFEPGERLPVRPHGVKNLMEHDWYKSNSFGWELLVAQKMSAPFLPEVVGDASNFIAHENEAPPEMDYVDPHDGWDADFEDAWGPRTFDIV